MKRTISIILLLVAIMTMVAFGQQAGPPAEDPPTSLDVVVSKEDTQSLITAYNVYQFRLKEKERAEEAAKRAAAELSVADLSYQNVMLTIQVKLKIDDSYDRKSYKDVFYYRKKAEKVEKKDDPGKK